MSKSQNKGGDLRISILGAEQKSRTKVTSSNNCVGTVAAEAEGGDRYVRVLSAQGVGSGDMPGGPVLNEKSTRALRQARRGEMNEYEDLNELFG